MPKPTKTLRWTVQHAADEFGLDRKTLAKMLKAADQAPGPDGLFSTRQVYLALAGDLDKARVREANARAEKLELEVAELRGQLVRVPAVLATWSNIVVAFRQGIKHCSMSAVEKEALLKGLREMNEGDLVGGING